MAKKTWREEFLEYMDMIASCPNYSGLPILRNRDGSLKWIATAKSQTGMARKRWALLKAADYGFPDEPGVYAKVMFAVHPTKMKVCQICGREMSLYYIYPNANFKKDLEKRFKIPCSNIVAINDYFTDVLKKYSEQEVKDYLIKRFGLPESYDKKRLNQILDECEKICREGKNKSLGPGAMSNFPDRADGFHTYNRCCRSKEDTGRTKANLKTYTKDRRAYEYWSDGNIHAANQYMGSSYFDKSSADHIGPISLGFVHDSLFLRKMSGGKNSAKRDRLLYEDINKMIDIEKKEKVSAASWYAQLIWDYIKQNYKNDGNLLKGFEKALKQNMNNFMYILWGISERGGQDGKNFLFDAYIFPKYNCFHYDYEFGNEGKIVSKKPRNITASTNKELDRFKRISFKSIKDYHAKTNRKVKANLTNSEEKELSNIINSIPFKDKNSIKNMLKTLVEKQERRIISNLKAGRI